MTRWQEFTHEHWRLSGFAQVIAIVLAIIALGTLADWILTRNAAPARHQDTNEIQKVPAGYWLGMVRAAGFEPANRHRFTEKHETHKRRAKTASITVFPLWADNSITTQFPPCSAILSARGGTKAAP